jgi:acyl-CoA thioester hydrolase
MNGLRDYAGRDLKTLAKLQFMVCTQRMEVDFLRLVVGDQELTITSFVREFQGPDAHIECSMVDEAGKNVSRCLMIVAYVDQSTNG